MGTLLSRSLALLPATETAPRPNLAPNRSEVYETLALLKRRGLPIELGIDILNAAGYWPRVRVFDKSHRSVRASAGETVEKVILLSPNVRGKAVGQAKVIVDSRDQGWSSFPEFHQTREGSTSWFELGILRAIPNSTTPANNPAHPTTPLESPSLASNTFSYLTTIGSRLSTSESTTSMQSAADSQGSFSSEMNHSTTSKSQRERLSNYYLVGDRRHLLHYNVHAGRTFVESCTVFHSSKYPPLSAPPSTATLQTHDTALSDHTDEEEEEKENWVDQIQEGDIIAIWALAKYAGWLNEIRGVSLELDLVVL